MNPIDRSIASAGRRIFMQDSLTALGWAGAARGGSRQHAAPADGVGCGRCRSRGGGYAVVAGLALLIAPVAAWVRRPDRATVAAMIDHRLKLKDRLATALYAVTLTHDPFARRVIEDASAAANDLHIREGFALRLHRVWGYVPPAGRDPGCSWALLVPQADLLGINAAALAAAPNRPSPSKPTEQVGQVVAAIQKLHATTPELKENEGDADLQQQLAEMTQADLRDPEMRKNIAAKLSDVDSKLGQAADQKQQQFQPLQNAMSRLGPMVPGPADRFADALRRGDFDSACRELDQLAKSAASMSEADKQALAQQLKNLADQLNQAAKDAAQQQAQAQQQMAQTLKNAGLSQQQVQQLQQQNFNQQAVQQALQKQGASQQQAQQVQQKIQQLQQQCQNAGQCSGGTQAMASPLGRMAQSMSQKPGGNSSSQQQQQMQQSASIREPAAFTDGPDAAATPAAPAVAVSDAAGDAVAVQGRRGQQDRHPEPVANVAEKAERRPGRRRCWRVEGGRRLGRAAAGAGAENQRLPDGRAGRHRPRRRAGDRVVDGKRPDDQGRAASEF